MDSLIEHVSLYLQENGFDQLPLTGELYILGASWDGAAVLFQKGVWQIAIQQDGAQFFLFEGPWFTTLTVLWLDGDWGDVEYSAVNLLHGREGDQH